jgi:rhodanese-related sulfurtransferase
MRRRDWGGALLGAFAILLGSAALGLLVNHVSPRGIPIFVRTVEAGLPLPEGVTGMTLAQAREVVDTESMPILDARTPEEYAAGHLPGALNLPAHDFENHFLPLADTITAAPSVMVYCTSADCSDGITLAQRLKEAYEGKIYLFERGWSQWVEAKYPVTKGDKP